MSARPIRVTHWKLGSIGKRKKEAEETETESPRPKRKGFGFRREPAWSVIGFFGWMLVIVGGIELAITVYPPSRSPEWEFATAVQLVSGLPVPTMGLVLVLASALKRRSRRVARIAASAMLVGSLSILAGLVVFGLTIPVALRYINDPFVRLGLMKAIWKTASQGSIYMLGLAVLGYQGWKRPRSSTDAEEQQDAT